MKTNKRWILLLPALLLPFTGTLFYFVIFKESHFVQILYSATKIFTLLWPIIALVLLRELGKNNFFTQLGISWKQFLIGVSSGGFLVLAMYLLMQTPVGVIVQASASQMQAKVESMGVLQHYILFAIAISLLHSLLEEYYWRWFVFGQLKECVTPGWAHLIAGVAFSSHHLIVTLQYFPIFWAWLFAILVGIGGIFWSLLYEKTRSLFAAWVCHIMVDLGIFWVGYQVVFG